MLTAKLAVKLASVILIGSFAVNVYLLAQLYILSMDNVSVQRQIDDFRSQILNLQSEKASLQDQLQT